MDERILDNDDEELSTYTSSSRITSKQATTQLDPAAGTSTDTAAQESASATASGKELSVGSLTQSFMQSINMGSNDVFIAPKKTTTPPPMWLQTRHLSGRTIGRGVGSQGSMRWSGRREGTGLRPALCLG